MLPTRGLKKIQDAWFKGFQISTVGPFHFNSVSCLVHYCWRANLELALELARAPYTKAHASGNPHRSDSASQSAPTIDWTLEADVLFKKSHAIVRGKLSSKSQFDPGTLSSLNNNAHAGV